jgi:ParB family chromosome partitioning protein
VSNLLRLLDLPDEVVETIEQESLSEGHGRALLLAEDHSTRRMLARDAVREGWSVRTVEARARTANEAGAAKGKVARGKTEGRVHPDQREAAATIAVSLEEALGAEVRVRAVGGGYRAELLFAGVNEAQDLARRVRARG